jgi:hypothetical protein
MANASADTKEQTENQIQDNNVLPGKVNEVVKLAVGLCFSFQCYQLDALVICNTHLAFNSIHNRMLSLLHFMHHVFGLIPNKTPYHQLHRMQKADIHMVCHWLTSRYKTHQLAD